MEHLAQILLLLAVAIAIVVTFQRLHIPTSLGYLLVPVVSMPELQTLAEFGVVFLLFTIGLNYSIPQLNALRHQILGLGTGQVVFTTLGAGTVMWMVGLPVAAAFVFGAVFAQSSTTIISSLLTEQGEENSQHGRLGLAMSVFQDVTAVPFLVIIPVLGMAVTADVLALTVAAALAKAVLAFVLVFFAGRWLLGPLFHLVTRRNSLETFTLAFAAWTTNSLGLSLAFGGFLAGMMLGETEFRHQVESSVSPFRDVLLGLFFIGIGMRFDPSSIQPIWQWAVFGALLILVSKILIVALMVHRTTADKRVAWRTGGAGHSADELKEAAEQRVVVAGYGRVGHTIAVLLHSRGIPFVAVDTDIQRVAQGRQDGHQVFYGDITDPGLLSVIQVDRASLLVVTVDDAEAALGALSYMRKTCPQVPVIVRSRDLESSTRLLNAGATHAYPEMIEASLRLGASALQILNVPDEEIDQMVQGVRDWGYRPVLEKDVKAP